MTLSSTAALTLGIHTLLALTDFFNTLIRTEASEMVRRDHNVDKLQERMLYSWMAKRSRESSQQMLVEATRGNP